MTEPTIDRSDDAPLSAAKRKRKSRVLESEHVEGFELVGRTVTINRPRTELYGVFRDLRNLALFMENIERVEVIDATHSHWVVSAPAGERVEWDSVIEEDIPGEVISWSSVPGSGLDHSGRIEFRDAHGGRGTEVTATILYDPPAGKIGKAIAKLFQKEPNIQARRDLRRFKQLMETGEIATSEPPLAAPRDRK
jgi:uncharacterized membrane protein